MRKGPDKKWLKLRSQPKTKESKNASCLFGSNIAIVTENSISKENG